MTAGFQLPNADPFGNEYVPDVAAPDPVNHPGHYQTPDGLEAIDVIEAFKFNFHLGNAFKYIARAGKKNTYIQDLEKAAWYINREIERVNNA